MRQLFSITTLLLLILLGGCSTVGKNIAGINNFDEVSSTLYRGAQPNAKGFQTLAAMHVKTVINLRDESDPKEAALVKAAGMNYIALPQDASKATLADAENFLAQFDQAQRPVFVHCHAGRDRTGLVVAAYRMRIQQWTRAAALKDLYTHGHHWLLFPKVRAVVASILPTPLAPAAAIAAIKTPQ